jgi:RHS repeat-associated protein
MGRRTKLVGTAEADKGYTGHYVHSRTGLALAPYRAYSADLGRWINRDPLGPSGGLNLYGYVLNQTVSAIDPTGLNSLKIDSSCKGHDDLIQNATYLQRRTALNSIEVSRLRADLLVPTLCTWETVHLTRSPIHRHSQFYVNVSMGSGG